MNDRERTLHLSPVQVVASALASITAAVLASFFGVAGTVIGAGVVSAAASIGSAVYSYSIRSTRKALRQTLPSAFKDTLPSALKQPGTTVRSLVSSGARVSSASKTAAGGAGGDPDDTNEVPDRGPSWVVPPPGSLGPPPIASGRGPGAPPPLPGVPEPKRRDLGASIEALWSRLLHLVHTLRWRNIALATVAAFGLAMASITAVEALAKKPLSGIVGGSTPAGATTSLGGLVGGRQSDRPPTSPTSTTTPSSPTTNPETTTPNGSSTTTPPPSTTTTPSTPTTTTPSSVTPSTPPSSSGSTPGTSGSSSGAASSGGSSSSGNSAVGPSSSGGTSGTQTAGG